MFDFEKHRKPVVLGLVGLVLVVLSVLVWRIQAIAGKTEGVVEVVEPTVMPTLIISKLTVEVAGAVNRPGVFTLSDGSRINDLIATAGGYSAKADTKWAAQNINLAQKLADGQKIYVAEVGEQVVTGVAGTSAELGTSLVNINTASISQLDTLWGIGEATAKKHCGWSAV